MDKLQQELPPHARRRDHGLIQYPLPVGITSACAEKRLEFIVHHYTGGNYLRMRGEEPGISKTPPTPRELPPHARRREGMKKAEMIAAGITSACAEKRYPRWKYICLPGNYLRMRGEEGCGGGARTFAQELPSHARRRVRMNKIKIPWARNYLRMRGEEIQLASEHVQELELPPHARRRADLCA